ncbi:hypothetical protein WG906_03135 [Pedobacter sp. P351]|uniref:carboxypeptidase-like regulatory domain-containing protein n=1 Tax=Pedobacter superstes TaxID=3133441 RepID=UPI00309975B0
MKSASAQNSTKLFFEKVYLHTDREHYVAGDNIWFKAYLVNGQNHQLSGSSNNLYVELINSEAKISERRLIRVNNGVGNGVFSLGDSISPGTYRLKAYTSWMRNFGDNLVFEKRIQIVRNLELAPTKPDYGKIQTSFLNASSAATGATKYSNRITFLQEGDSAIEGVPTIVGFKTEDRNGNGILASGSIYSNGGDKVTEFQSDSLGLGRFVLVAQPATSYEARGTYSTGEGFVVPIPQGQIRGFSMYARITDSLLKVSIRTNAITLNDLKDKQLILIGKSKGKICFTHAFPLKDLEIPITISKSSLPVGIIALTLYDPFGKPHCERLVYNEGPEKITLTISTDKLSYQSKEKVKLTLKATDQNNRPAKVNLSIAVADAGIVPDNAGNILSYFHLESELKGRIENIFRYFNEANSKRLEQLDLLLSVQGRRDFVWKRLADSSLHISYPLEQGITISGKVREVSKDKPVIGANVTLSAFGAKGDRLFSTTTDSIGRYYFDAVQLYGKQLITLTSRDVKGAKNGWVMMDSLSTNTLAVKSFRLSESNTLLKKNEVFRERALVRKNQVDRFSLSDTIRLNDVQIRAKSTIRLSNAILNSFGYKDEVFNVDPKDYDHANLRHYLLHYSSASADAGNYLGWVYAGALHYPRLIVNNKELRFDDKDVEIRSAFYDQYLNMPVSKVKKIVIKHMIGTRLDNPSTKTEDFWVIYLTIDPNAFEKREYDRLQAEVTGYDDARVFFAPNYDQMTSKPDLRTTIHWQPNIITDENGEATINFFNADPKTPVRIVAEGITDNGTPCVGSLVYHVK